MSYEGLGAQVYAASELGSRIQPWWNVRQITPAGETGPLRRYPRRFATPVDGGSARPVATLYGRQIGPRGPEGGIEALGNTTEAASIIPLPLKVVAGAISAYVVYVLLIKPIKENPEYGEVLGVRVRLYGTRLGYQQREALKAIIMAGMDGISYNQALSLRGKARDYSGRYLRALGNIVGANPELFEETYSTPTGGFGARYIGPPTELVRLRQLKTRSPKVNLVTPVVAEKLETAWLRWRDGLRGRAAYRAALKTANEWLEQHERSENPGRKLLGMSPQGERLFGELNPEDIRYKHVFAVKDGKERYVGQVLDTGGAYFAVYPSGKQQIAHTAKQAAEALAG